MAIDRVEIKKGSSVLDYCAGAGGKSLMIADKLSGSGRVDLYDIRKKALTEGKRRLEKGGY